ncbi:MAG: hypothetical protein UW43_C0006G0009 [Candidatus Yanofskybacteria bacterium GW2011_GWA1_44_21]|uniref:Uncharacterized protein n=1 Tax=Candidatus Yanofskybacteria bacterium GW2011_GWB1_45_11 TaxID=1619026 RepID=A0A0G1NAW8_9BACT|nr:MAG: hypothetical protein UW43_C0006G0009 [Candidatus Yanofskybacteria bacterium GW2011_GWA1_44_21]KKT90242.1 MAG: hypothetical protein UW90_C0004G0048 [Candidatus Yanofskybacteria bacterium GW2011_GWB1_45_11]
MITAIIYLYTREPLCYVGQICLDTVPLHGRVVSMKYGPFKGRNYRLSGDFTLQGEIRDEVGRVDGTYLYKAFVEPTADTAHYY